MAATKKKAAAADFQKIVSEGRDRKKTEAFAARIFNKGRRNSAPIQGPASLASRLGVKKRVAPSAPRPAGNINGDWTHDLHDAVSAPSTPLGSRGAPRTRPNALASRTSLPGAVPQAQMRSQRRAAQVAHALTRVDLRPQGNRPPQLSNESGNRAGSNGADSGFKRGMSIRGLAGPFVVTAQNFAPGTTAADIESAMTPIGGLITSCRLLKTSPIVIAEIVFENKEGADNVIATFDNQTADGRQLRVYHKVGGTSTPPASAPTGPRSERTDNVIDGTMGFGDAMETDEPVRQSGNGGLYSDQMVRGQRGRRGRGFARGGR